MQTVSRHSTAAMHLTDEPRREAELRRMQRLATGLLVLVSVVFVATRILERQYSWVAFIRATAEAAMVGAIADWFAVNALFRYPFGLKIPHTAIIPQRKDSIGESIGRFAQDNFLSPDMIIGRMRHANAARTAVRWVQRDDHSATLARLIATVIGSIVRVIDDNDVQALIERALRDRLAAVRATPLIGRVLALLLGGQRRDELIVGTIRLAARVLEQNHAAIHRKIEGETPWWLPRAFDRQISQRVIDSLTTTLADARADPQHPLYLRLAETLDQLVAELQYNEDLIARGEAFKAELLAHPLVRDIAASLWSDLKQGISAQASRGEGELHASLQRWIARLGGALSDDELMLEKVNHWIEAGVRFLINEYGHEVARLISQTVSRWDPAMTTRKIELQIGKDLQYIRINGTIVGGLAGLAIYTISRFF